MFPIESGTVPGLKRATRVLGALLVAHFGGVALSQPVVRSADPEPPPPIEADARLNPPNPAFATVALSVPRHVLGPLSRSERSLLRDAKTLVPPAGVVRHLGIAATLTPHFAMSGLGLPETMGDRRIWTAWIASEGADAIRIQLRAHHFPRGSVAWVYDEAEHVLGPYDLESDETTKTFWTNTVFGLGAFVEVQVPLPDNSERAPVLEIPSVAHINVNPDSLDAAPEGFECMRDAACFSDEDWPQLSNLSTAVGQMAYIKNGLLFICTGALIADTLVDSTIPYFLTANHCLDTQDVADGVETFWDFRTPSCGGNPPDKNLLPRVLGATLLATDLSSDFTLLRLPARPPGAWSFGWTTDPAVRQPGTHVYTIGHPFARPLVYSEDVIPEEVTNSCRSHVDYVFKKRLIGTSGPGGSGSPAALADGRLIGQLGGICGESENDPCGAADNYILDGWFGTTFNYVKEWLDPNGTLEPCTPSSTVFCTQSNRFEVSLIATDPRTGQTDSGYVMASSDFFGYYAFPVIASNTTDPQLFVKVLDGRSINGRFWVFYASLTDVAFTLTIRDTITGDIRSYTQEPYEQSSRSDTTAF